mgnify:CR=1 FL=1
MMGKTVKAREHYGADSLDLTIPTSTVEEHDLSPGDIFEVNVKHGDDEVVITYELVHRSG